MSDLETFKIFCEETGRDHRQYANVHLFIEFAEWSKAAQPLGVDMPCPKCGEYSNGTVKKCNCASPVAPAPRRLTATRLLYELEKEGLIKVLGSTVDAVGVNIESLRKTLDDWAALAPVATGETQRGFSDWWAKYVETHEEDWSKDKMDLAERVWNAALETTSEGIRLTRANVRGYEKGFKEGLLVISETKERAITILKAALRQTGCDGDLCVHEWHEEARRIINETLHD